MVDGFNGGLSSLSLPGQFCFGFLFSLLANFLNALSVVVPEFRTTKCASGQRRVLGPHRMLGLLKIVSPLLLLRCVVPLVFPLLPHVPIPHLLILQNPALRCIANFLLSTQVSPCISPCIRKVLFGLRDVVSIRCTLSKNVQGFYIDEIFGKLRAETEENEDSEIPWKN